MAIPEFLVERIEKLSPKPTDVIAVWLPGVSAKERSAIAEFLAELGCKVIVFATRDQDIKLLCEEQQKKLADMIVDVAVIPKTQSVVDLSGKTPNQAAIQLVQEAISAGEQHAHAMPSSLNRIGLFITERTHHGAARSTSYFGSESEAVKALANRTMSPSVIEATAEVSELIDDGNEYGIARTQWLCRSLFAWNRQKNCWMLFKGAGAKVETLNADEDLGDTAVFDLFNCPNCRAMVEQKELRTTPYKQGCIHCLGEKANETGRSG